MTPIERLDALYEISIRTEVEEKDRKEIVALLEGIDGVVSSCIVHSEKKPDFFTKEQIAKLRIIRKLIAEEVCDIGKGIDVLTHYVLLREYIFWLIDLIKLRHLNFGGQIF